MARTELRTSIRAIEEEISLRIAAEEAEYDLDDDDRQEIRDEVYQSYGFDHDPFYEEPGYENDSEYDAWEDGYPRHRNSEMLRKLAEVGMSERDFF